MRQRNTVSRRQTFEAEEEEEAEIKYMILKGKVSYL
jgi:hypothetical protein